MADLLVSFLDSILVALMEFMATFMLVFMAFMVESLGAMAALGRRWMHLQVVAQASLGLWNGFQKKESKHMITCKHEIAFDCYHGIPYGFTIMEIHMLYKWVMGRYRSFTGCHIAIESEAGNMKAHMGFLLYSNHSI